MCLTPGDKKYAAIPLLPQRSLIILAGTKKRDRSWFSEVHSSRRKEKLECNAARFCPNLFYITPVLLASCSIRGSALGNRNPSTTCRNYAGSPCHVSIDSESHSAAAVLQRQDIAVGNFACSKKPRDYCIGSS